MSADSVRKSSTAKLAYFVFVFVFWEKYPAIPAQYWTQQEKTYRVRAIPWAQDSNRI